MSYDASYDTTGIEYYTIPNFTFVGGTTKNIKVAYRSFNPDSNQGTILIPTCFGGRINKTLSFTSGALKDHHVVVVAMLGNSESSSPSNDAEFPIDYSLRYQDCINSQYTLLTEHLGVSSLEAVIGHSMGGQQAYYWAVMHGTGSSPYVKRAVVICGSAQTSGINYAFLDGPASALMESHDYDHGRYKDNGVHPIQGLRAFGRVYMAWVASAGWFREELWRLSGAETLQEWLHPPMGTMSYEKWDPEDLLVKLRMWQAGNVGAAAGEGDYKEALKMVTAKMLVMPCETDQYFTPEDVKTEVSLLRDATFDPIPSIWGHMAGGGRNADDVNWLNDKISKFLAGS